MWLQVGSIEDQTDLEPDLERSTLWRPCSYPGAVLERLLSPATPTQYLCTKAPLFPLQPGQDTSSRLKVPGGLRPAKNSTLSQGNTMCLLTVDINHPSWQSAASFDSGLNGPSFRTGSTGRVEKGLPASGLDTTRQGIGARKWVEPGAQK